MLNWLVGTRRGVREVVQQFGNRGGIHSSADDRVRDIGKALSTSTVRNTTKCDSHHTYYPLRIFWLASLLFGTQAQRTDAFPTQIELSSLNGSNGFVINGEQAADLCGYSVSNAGDVNGDGIADLLIGARNASPSGMFAAGKSYVIFGRTTLGSSGIFDLNSLNGKNGFVMNGKRSYDRSGISVSNAGDVNGDGIVDVLIGANGGDPSGKNAAGFSYVVFGGMSLMSSGVLELARLNNTQGVVIHGDQVDDHSGYSVSDAGDVNGDGMADLLIGAYEAAPNGRFNAGRTFVVFGGVGLGRSGVIELSSLNGQNGFILNGEAADDKSGFSVSSGGDVNGDGIADLLIGAYQAAPSGKSEAGKTYVIFGGVDLGASGVLELSTLNGTNGFVLLGEKSGDDSGKSVSRAGDVNGDGIADLLAGADDADPSGKKSAGKTFVVFGSAGLGSNGILELSSLNGANGFVINGEKAGDVSGSSVSCAGDINGDGMADFLIGARKAAPSGKSNAGITYVVFGAKGIGSGGVLELSTLDGSNGFVLNGETTMDQSSFAISGVGDVNGDGTADLLIGAPYASPSGRMQAGKTYVVFGRPVITTQISSTYISTTSSRSSTLSHSSQESQTSRRSVIASQTDPQQTISTLESLHQPNVQSTANILQTSAYSVEGFRSPTLTTQDMKPQADMQSFTHADNRTTSEESIGNDDLWAGIACAVAALFCSIVTGGVVAWMKLKHQNHNDKEQVEIALSQMSVDEAQLNTPKSVMSTPREKTIYVSMPSTDGSDLSSYGSMPSTEHNASVYVGLPPTAHEASGYSQITFPNDESGFSELVENIT